MSDNLVIHNNRKQKGHFWRKRYKNKAKNYYNRYCPSVHTSDIRETFGRAQQSPLPETEEKLAIDKKESRGSSSSTKLKHFIPKLNL